MVSSFDRLDAASGGTALSQTAGFLRPFPTTSVSGPLAQALIVPGHDACPGRLRLLVRAGSDVLVQGEVGPRICLAPSALAQHLRRRGAVRLGKQKRPGCPMHPGVAQGRGP